MKDPADSKTADLIPHPKRRGRPPTGKAMTPAQRKAKQRERDLDQKGPKTMTVTGLVEGIGQCFKLGMDELLLLYAQELADRIRANKKA